MPESDHHADQAPAPAVVVHRSVVNYRVPGLTLVREDGSRVNLAEELSQPGPVIVAFIYTSCSSVCPLTSQILSQVQRMPGVDEAGTRILSISIDPEADTPPRLREYAREFHAGARWHYYTGTLAASQSAQHAFDVYRGNKMNHSPAIFVRRSGVDSWVRLDGFASAQQVADEITRTSELSVTR